MPGKNGTGPMGAGPMTGRGLGVCGGSAATAGRGFGRGLGCQRGFGRGFGRGFNFGWLGAGRLGNRNTRENLIEQKKILQEELNLINNDLEDMDKKEQK